MNDSKASRSDRVEALGERIAALEAENAKLRRSKRFTLIAMVVLFAVPLVAAYTVQPDLSGQVLNVRGLNIVDKEGVHRIEMGISPASVTQSATFYGRTLIRRAPPGAYVLFFDDEGTEQGGIGIPDDGGMFYGLDSRTGQNISLGTSADGRSAAIRFWTVAGGERKEAMIGVSAERGPIIRLESAGEVIYQFPAPDDDNAAAAPEDT